MRSTILQFCYSTLKTISSHRGIVSGRNSWYKIVCVYQHLSVFINTDFSWSLAIEIMNGNFFLAHPYIECYRTLVFKCIYLYSVVQKQNTCSYFWNKKTPDKLFTSCYWFSRLVDDRMDSKKQKGYYYKHL